MDYQLNLSKISDKIESDKNLSPHYVIQCLDNMHLPIEQALLNVKNICACYNDVLWIIFCTRMTKKYQDIRREHFAYNEIIYSYLVELKNSNVLTDSEKGITIVLIFHIFY